MGLAVEAGVSAPNGSAEGTPANAEWGLLGGGLPAGRAGVSQAEAAAVAPGPAEGGLSPAPSLQPMVSLLQMARGARSQLRPSFPV